MADPNFKNQNSFVQQPFQQQIRNVPGNVNGHHQFPPQYNAVQSPTAVNHNYRPMQGQPPMQAYQQKNIYPPPPTSSATSVQSPEHQNKNAIDPQSKDAISNSNAYKQTMNTSSPNLPSLTTNQIPHIENKFNNLNVHDYCEAQQPIPSVKSVPNFNLNPLNNGLNNNNNVNTNSNYNNTTNNKPTNNISQAPPTQLPPPPNFTSTANPNPPNAAFQPGVQTMVSGRNLPFFDDF